MIAAKTRVLGCLIPALLLAAAPLPARAALKHQGVVVYAHHGEVTTLDPIYPYEAVTQGMLLNVYDTLIRFSGESLTRFAPALASKVPAEMNGLVSADGLVYCFPLRRGVRFHNGDILNAEDVRYSLLRFMLIDPAGGPAALLLEPVFGLTSTRGADGKFNVSQKDFNSAIKVNGDSVVIRLKKPFAPFLSIMARWSYVMDKKWCVANGEWDGTYETLAMFNNRPKESSYLYAAANGTGPFMVEKWDRNLREVTLKAFPRYWSGPARINRAILRTVPEFGARKSMLESGEADIIDLPPPYEPQLLGLPGIRVVNNLPRLLDEPVIFFNFKINPYANPYIGSGKLDGEGIPPDFFADADIRRAFAYSFDYENYLRTAGRGAGTRSRGAIPPGLTGYDVKAPVYEFNRTRAEEYFRKAGGGEVWTKGFRLTLIHNTGGDLARIACENLKHGIETMNLRFHIDIKALDWPVYIEETQSHKMPLFARGWTGDYPDPHNFAFPFYHSKGRYPLIQGYSDPEMDKLIEAAVAENSVAKRALLYARLQAKAYETVPQIYTAHPKGLYAMRENIKGFYDNAVFMGIYFYPLSKL